jgi:hypothetical protein
MRIAALPPPPPGLLWPQGAVLEPQGVVEIKFRAPELVAAMHRLDPVILRLKVSVCACVRVGVYVLAGAPGQATLHRRGRQERFGCGPTYAARREEPMRRRLADGEERRAACLQADGSPGCEAAIRERERQLLPVYHQVAVQFAQVRGKGGRAARVFQVCAEGGRVVVFGLLVWPTFKGWMPARAPHSAFKTPSHPSALLPPPPPANPPDARRPRAHAVQARPAGHRALACRPRLFRRPPQAPPH